MGALVTAFGLAAILLEPPLFFLADRFGKKRFIVGGLAALGLANGLAAAAPSYGWLFLALLLFGPASGLGVGLSQAALVDSDPKRPETWLHRWTLAGALGDLAAPALVGLTLWLGWGWRGAFAVCGALSLLFAVLIATRPFPAPTGGDDAAGDPGWQTALRQALTHRRLLVWAAALVACSLLDEILIVLATLRMTRDLGLAEGQALWVIAALSLGGVVALALTESRSLRRRISTRPLALLVTVCLVSIGAHLAFVLAPSLPWLLALAPVSGAAIALQYPLAKAQLYRALPGRTGTALAVAGLFGPIDLALPVLLGLAADHFGLTLALLLLTLQPTALLAAAAVREPTRRQE